MHPYRLARVFDVLTQIADSGQPTVSELARALEMPVSSAHDLLTALVDIEAVSVRDRRYELGPRAFALGLRVSDAVAVRRVAAPHMARLVEEIGHDVYLAVRSGTRVIYVDRCRGASRINIDIPLGQPLYLHSTAVGKLYAAYDAELRDQVLAGPLPRLTRRTIVEPERLQRDLASIRRIGFSVSREESVEGIVGLGAPVWGPHGRLAAALHVSALKARLKASDVGPIGAALLASAERVGRGLGVSGRPEVAA